MEVTSVQEPVAASRNKLTSEGTDSGFTTGPAHQNLSSQPGLERVKTSVTLPDLHEMRLKIISKLTTAMSGSHWMLSSKAETLNMGMAAC